MKLVPNWKKILRHAWSVRLMFVAAFFSGLEYLLPYLQDISPWRIPPRLFAGVGFFVVVSAAASRFVVQAKISGDIE